jgi:predicted small lipoprotein YifL
VTPATRAAIALIALASAAACGQKGPPLPPLRPVPVAPTEVTVRRSGEQVRIQFRIPTANQDPAAPLSLSRVDIYARSFGFGAPEPTHGDVLHRDYLIGSVEVQPPVPADAPPPDPAAPADSRPAPGDLATWSDTMPAVPPGAMARNVLALPLPPSSVAVPFARIAVPTRYYVVVGVSRQGRNGATSPMLPVRLGGVPEPPTDAAITYTESALTLSWTATAGDGVVIYEQATPVQAAPLTTGVWTTPTTFGAERCFTLRSVRVDGPVSTESAPSATVCDTPVDTFAPPVPEGAVGAAEPGRISLLWDAVQAEDLAGYHVLRREGAGATLQQLTTAPTSATTYVDTTSRAGVEYMYVVVAVDRAGNLSAQSQPVLLTGRQ